MQRRIMKHIITLWFVFCADACNAATDYFVQLTADNHAPLKIAPQAIRDGNNVHRSSTTKLELSGFPRGFAIHLLRAFR